MSRRVDTGRQSSLFATQPCQPCLLLCHFTARQRTSLSATLVAALSLSLVVAVPVWFPFPTTPPAEPSWVVGGEGRGNEGGLCGGEGGENCGGGLNKQHTAVIGFDRAAVVYIYRYGQIPIESI